MERKDISTRMEVLRKDLPTIRLLYGWTREDIAERLGTTINTVSSIENHGMTKMQFHAICNVIVEEYAMSNYDKCHTMAADFYNEVWVGRESTWRLDDLIFSDDEFKQWLKSLTFSRRGAKANAEHIEKVLEEKWNNIEILEGEEK